MVCLVIKSEGQMISTDPLVSWATGLAVGMNSTPSAFTCSGNGAVHPT